jgi:hypothetical protein
MSIAEFSDFTSHGAAMLKRIESGGKSMGRILRGKIHALTGVRVELLAKDSWQESDRRDACKDQWEKLNFETIKRMNEKYPDTHGTLVACLKKYRAELIAATGIQYAFVRVEIGTGNTLEFTTYADGGRHQVSDTFAGSLLLQVEANGPAARAAEIRARVANLLAEAARLEASA